MSNRVKRRNRVRAAVRWAQHAAWAVEAKPDEARMLLMIALLVLTPAETEAESLEPGFAKFMNDPRGRALARIRESA